MAPSRSSRLTCGAAFAASIVLLVHAWSYLPFIADDALISLRYAERFADGRGLTWNDGERVEGYSNLLWVLLCAAFARAGIDPILASRVLGVTGSVAALVALARAYPATSLPGALPALAAGLGLALSGSIAVWCVGGLEQPLLAGLLAWSLTLCFPLVAAPDAGGRARWLLPGALLALLCWTRPDGVVFAAAAGAGLVAAAGFNRASLRLGLGLVLLPLLACAAQLGFRLVYYGEWVPNSALAKVAFTLDRLRAGLAYLGWGIAWLAPLVLLAGAALPAARSDPIASRRVRFLMLPGLLWSAYVVVIGGDIFPARRHFVPLVLILSLLVAEGLRVFVARGRPSSVAAWVAAAACLVVLGSMQQLDVENQRARFERWEWDGEVAGTLLRKAFSEQQPLLAAEAAGTLPYFSGLPSIDMLGINDRFLARNRPADFGHGWIGHELGSGRYVLDRGPDIVVFCHPKGGPLPCYRSTRELAGDPRFAERYRLISVQGVEPYPLRSWIWVRVEGSRIGIQREGDRVVLPGYLLMANRESLARLDPVDRLSVVIDARTPASFLGLPLRPGAWQMRARFLGPPVIARFRSPGGSWETVEEGSGSRFELEVADAGVIDLFIASRAEELTYLSELVLERRGAPSRPGTR